MAHLRASLLELSDNRNRKFYALLIQDDEDFRAVVIRYYDELRMYLVSRGADGEVNYRTFNVTDLGLALPRHTFSVTREDVGISPELLEKTVNYLKLRHEGIADARQAFRKALPRD